MNSKGPPCLFAVLSLSSPCSGYIFISRSQRELLYTDHWRYLQNRKDSNQIQQSYILLNKMKLKKKTSATDKMWQSKKGGCTACSVLSIKHQHTKKKSCFNRKCNTEVFDTCENISHKSAQRIKGKADRQTQKREVKSAFCKSPPTKHYNCAGAWRSALLQ